ncbi:DNA polymerase III subunit beta [Streptomyces sp. NBC_01456]|uniref:DNA polymerase III subunit beta n=1 Tax=Streptomyces sp. NBC_01456 TaxID=2975868 RepID=UPI002E2F10F2|nr:DNA polymerase III subunit beta [Streptomyces sp. NBC_01456]
MKVRIPRRALADATSWSAGHLAAKPTVPARAGLLLSASDDHLTVAGVDWDVTTHSTLAADVLEPGRIVISGRLAAQVIATYRSDLIDITVDGGRATLSADRDRFMLTLLPEADYPAIAARPASDGTVAGEEFAEAVRQVAIATDPTVAAEPWRGGIQLTAEGDRLTVWATDRYRMAERSVAWMPADGGQDSIGALVPARSLADAVKGMAATGNLGLTLNGKTAGLSDDTRYTTLVRIDEQGRKDPHQFIPDGFVTEAIVPVDQLVAATKRACLVATDRKPKILIGFGTDEISVRAAGEDTGAVAMDIVDGQHLDGPAIQMAFLPANLLDGLQAIGTSDVRIGLTSNVRPALLHAVGEESDYRYLVMPVRL